MKNFIYFSCIVLLSIACKNEEATLEEQSVKNEIYISKKLFQSNEMQFGQLILQDMEQTIQVNGYTSVPPQHSATLSSYLPGYLKSIPLKIGDFVEAGQVVLHIESHELLELQKEFVQVAQQMKFLKSEYERQKTLYEEKIISQKNYLKTESEYQSNKATYENIKQRLLLYGLNTASVENGSFSNLLSIKSPIAGYVTKINTNPGAFVDTSEHLIEIVNPKFIQLELKVFEKDLTNLEAGQSIIFYTQNSTERYNSEITHLNKVISTSDRSINIFGKINKELQERLAVGMFVNANIIIGSQKVMVVPVDAVLTDENHSYVFVLKSEQDQEYIFEKKIIQTGQKNEEYIEVLPESKISSNDKILFKGQFYL